MSLANHHHRRINGHTPPFVSPSSAVTVGDIGTAHALTDEYVGERGVRGRHLPFLVLILSVKDRNYNRRGSQRRTWLGCRWVQADHEVPWRYVYIYASPGKASDLPISQGVTDKLVGDGVTLSAVTELYENLVFKTLESLRWAYEHVSFGALLKTDDDSMVHVSRLWGWILYTVQEPRCWAADQVPPRSKCCSLLTPAARGHACTVYAGRLQLGSQVIRSNMTMADLWHPEWFPADFRKWAVPFEAFDRPAYPDYVSGGGYVLGFAAVGMVLNAYAKRAGPPIYVEDVMVGILANVSGISPIGLQGAFKDPAIKEEQDEEVFRGKMLVHRVKEPMQAFKWLVLGNREAKGPGGRRQRKGRVLLGGEERCGLV